MICRISQEKLKLLEAYLSVMAQHRILYWGQSFQLNYHKNLLKTMSLYSTVLSMYR